MNTNSETSQIFISFGNYLFSNIFFKQIRKLFNNL